MKLFSWLFKNSSKPENRQKVAYQAFMGTNYGTILQTFALYHVLEKKFNCDVEIIGCGNFRNRQTPDEKLKETNLGDYLALTMRKTFENFNEAEFKYNLLLDKIPPEGLLTVGQEKELSTFDSVICGSDQVWKPSSFWFCGKRYMNYATKLNLNTIGYAPSVVVSSSEMVPQEYYEKWVEYMKAVRHVSTREISSSVFVSGLIGRISTPVIDPTLLLTRKDWESAFTTIPVIHEGIKNQIQDKDYCLIYFLDHFNYYKEQVFEICKKLHLEPVLLIGRDMGAKKTLNENCAYTDPNGFMHLIQGAKLVLCDGFHGCCTSIANEIPFLFFKKPKMKYLDERLSDLFVRLNLMDNVYQKGMDIDLDKLSPKRVADDIAKQRGISLLYLEESLKKE